MMINRIIRYKLIALFCLLGLVTAGHASEAVLEQLQSGGHVALMRHALAPGTGDPAELTIGDCSTQRNLNDTGRMQARATGDYFREAGVQFQAVYSSEWCRCMETAELMELGSVQPLPAINSFFRNMQRREGQTAQLKSWLAQQSIDKPLLLVTHQVNITALTGVYPQSGEVVVGRFVNGEFTVTGTIDPR
jgi:phosphohistidine phosphatase SixA